MKQKIAQISMSSSSYKVQKWSKYSICVILASRTDFISGWFIFLDIYFKRLSHRVLLTPALQLKKNVMQPIKPCKLVHQLPFLHYFLSSSDLTCLIYFTALKMHYAGTRLTMVRLWSVKTLRIGSKPSSHSSFIHKSNMKDHGVSNPKQLK